jgi:hypothetical protein
MGLDQYLRVSKNFGSYINDTESASYDAIMAAAGLDKIGNSNSKYVTVEVTALYWRKANAIHGWFVNELAGGEDECQVIPVTRENITTLRDLCVDAMSVPAGMSLDTHARTVLPTSDGFFFGGSEIDDYYIQDLKDTIEGINRILEELPETGEGWDWRLTYQASW